MEENKKKEHKIKTPTNGPDKDETQGAAETATGEKAAAGKEQAKKKTNEEIIGELKSACESKEKEIEGLKERLLYQQADFENFKKLKAREKQEALRYGNETLIKELLPVIDNMERAIEHASRTEDSKNIIEGVELTLNGFLKVLEKFGVTRVDAVGKKFDPNLHEALYQEDKDDMEPGLVVSEFQKGYIMDGRLLRPSMVSVSVARKSETE